MKQIMNRNRFHINVEENRRGNQEWAIQRHWQYWEYKTLDENKQTKKHNTTQKTKKMRIQTPTIFDGKYWKCGEQYMDTPSQMLKQWKYHYNWNNNALAYTLSRNVL